MSLDPVAIWADMQLKTWPERYWMLSIAEPDAAAATRVALGSDGAYSCVIRDQGGVSAIVDETTTKHLDAEKVFIRERFGPFRVVSTNGELPFNVVGFLRPVLEVLNTAGIKAGPQCGTDHDHLFIHEENVERAERIIADFIEHAKRNRHESARPGPTKLTDGVKA